MKRAAQLKGGALLVDESGKRPLLIVKSGKTYNAVGVEVK
jgi:hypothetical protein